MIGRAQMNLFRTHESRYLHWVYNFFSLSLFTICFYIKFLVALFSGFYLFELSRFEQVEGVYRRFLRKMRI